MWKAKKRVEEFDEDCKVHDCRVKVRVRIGSVIERSAITKGYERDNEKWVVLHTRSLVSKNLENSD